MSKRKNELKSRNRIGWVAGVLLMVILMAGCRPKGVLSSRQMRNVLYDLHRTEAILQYAGYNYGHNEAVSKYYYEVLERHGVTQAQFDSSLVWYTDHPELFNKLYPKVIARFDEEIEAQKKREQPDMKATRNEWEMRHTRYVLNVDSVLEVGRKGWPLQWYKEPPKVEIEVPFAEKTAENAEKS